MGVDSDRCGRYPLDDIREYVLHIACTRQTTPGSGGRLQMGSRQSSGSIHLRPACPALACQSIRLNIEADVE